MRGPPRTSDLALITEAAAKVLKMQHISAYNGLHWEGGLPGPKGENSRTHIRDTYVPSCKISRHSVPPSPRYL